MASPEFDQLVERSHQGWAEFVKGNPEPAKELFSRRDDVTLANPFGLPAHGWRQVVDTLERAASLYKDGEVIGFEEVVKYVNVDLGYILEIERYKAKVGGREDFSSVALRVTSIMRQEDDAWKIVLRHADPITAPRPPESVVQQSST